MPTPQPLAWWCWVCVRGGLVTVACPVPGPSLPTPMSAHPPLFSPKSWVARCMGMTAAPCTARSPSPPPPSLFAQVYKGYSKITGLEVAVKVISIRRLDRKAQANLESEISILRRIRHDNIVRLLDVQVGTGTGTQSPLGAWGLAWWFGSKELARPPPPPPPIGGGGGGGGGGCPPPPPPRPRRGEPPGVW